jgi:hypothetical protein
MFKNVDGNQMLQILFQIVKAIRIKRNPISGRPLITNIWTQILANRVMTINAEWKQDGVKNPVGVELFNFAPARDIESGVVSKDLTPSIKAEYELGLPNNDVASQEFSRLLTYFTACFSTGMLPTPSKMSGQSTIMAKTVQAWRESAGLTPVWIEIISKTGVVKRLDSGIVEVIQGVFVANYDSIIADWQTGESRSGKQVQRVDWI